MGFFDNIRQQYGPEILKHVKEYSNNNRKLSSLRNRRIYLLKCRSIRVLPNHISHSIGHLGRQMEYKDAVTGQRIRKFVSGFGHRLMNFEVDLTHKNIQFLSARQILLEDIIREAITPYLWVQFRHIVSVAYNKIFNKVKVKNIKKLQRIRDEHLKPMVIQDKWISNISEVQLPEDVRTILALGPKFCLPPSKLDLNMAGLLSQFDPVFSNIQSQNEKDILAAKLANILTNYVHKNDFEHNPIINTMFINTSKFLREHPEIIVVQSDKCNVTTVMRRSQYDELALEQLNDTQCYQRLDRDPSNTIQQKANKYISSLKRANKITPKQASDLSFYRGTASKFYGLPKLHKDPITLRPIIASIDSPNFGIAKYVTEILTTSYDTSNAYFTRDSFDFALFVNGLILPKDFVIVSWDVVSLFTNITFTMTKQCIVDKWTDIEPNCPIPRDDFLEMLKFIFDTTIFSFGGVYYKQREGTPMGSLVSPIIAQYVVDYILNKSLEQFPFQVPFCKKFVDDIITSVPRNCINEALQILNAVDSSGMIKFTMEEETDCSVPFMDMKVIREGQTVFTDIYRKPMASSRYIHYLSYHPFRVKINLILNLKTRINKLSDIRFRDDNMRTLYNILKGNGYPDPLLKKLLFNTPDRDVDTNHVRDDGLSTDRFSYVTLPYINNLTSRITSVLPMDRIRIATRNVKKVGKLFSRLKDNTPILNQSQVVYEIPCCDCELVYVGQTTTTLSQRITLHRSNIRTSKQNCALTKHCLDNGHHPDYNSVKILDKENNTKRRLFLEMVRIYQNKNSMNSRRDIDGLSSIFSYLIDYDAKKHNSCPSLNTVSVSS
ncbi:hypothetical protein WA026_022230 [Henosepilachna vigintioctopunctata]|uniref:Helix-turn-helix domain-containing protein n=1 Tax=Henosepilachna vigintioctopunctata TaxID=420089 RepID=A0AAW1URK9_9CUCU